MTREELQDTQPPFPIDAPPPDDGFHNWTPEQWAQLEAWESWHDAWREALLDERPTPVTVLYPGGDVVIAASLADVPAPPEGWRWQSVAPALSGLNKPLLRLVRKEEE